MKTAKYVFSSQFHGTTKIQNRELDVDIFVAVNIANGTWPPQFEASDLEECRERRITKKH